MAIALLQALGYYFIMKNNYNILTNDSIWATGRTPDMFTFMGRLLD